MAKYSQFTIHRANKNKNGCASSFQLSKRPEGDVLLFLEVAKEAGEDQYGNSYFAWRNGKNATENGSVTLKLGTPDIGEILAVISGRKNNAGQEGKALFHKNQTGSSTLDFKLYQKDDKPMGFSMSVSNKTGDKDAVRLSHSVSFGEAEALRVFLQQALVHINNWAMSADYQPNNKSNTKSTTKPTSQKSSDDTRQTESYQDEDPLAY